MVSKVFIAGQKPLAESLFKLCLKSGLTVVGCACPEEDKHLKPLAESSGVKVVTPANLEPMNLFGADIGFCAHYFGYIGHDLLATTRLGWLGYHPSLLPLYKGKNSIIDTVNGADKIVGGSLYWLNEGLDKGDIAYQDFRVVNKALYDGDSAAKRLWVEILAPLGMELYERAIFDLKRGVVVRRPQLREII